MTTSCRPVAALRQVVKEFPTRRGPLRVLDGIDAVIHERDFVVVTGPSGSGKSTLLHVLSLLEPVTSGEVFLADQPTVALDDRARSVLRCRHLAMVFQRFHLLANRSVLDNVVFRFRYMAERPTDLRERAREALRHVGLEGMADKSARNLSGGEMQRVAIARAVVWSPRLLLADEPTGNLDRAAAEGIVRILGEINARGVAIVLVTHNPLWLKAGTCHWIMSGGRVAAGGA